MEDVYGCFSEIQLPEGCESQEAWMPLIDGQGRMFLFKNLQLQQRLLRSRCPGLFSIIDSVWQPCLLQKLKSESQDSSQGAGHPSDDLVSFTSLHLNIQMRNVLICSR